MFFQIVDLLPCKTEPEMKKSKICAVGQKAYKTIDNTLLKKGCKCKGKSASMEQSDVMKQPCVNVSTSSINAETSTQSEIPSEERGDQLISAIYLLREMCIFIFVRI